ncbi:MAG: O-antigen ligase family protein [Planctomycetaceae bacterium]|jgi:tetratricopeptide (TPR) repeat protein|nr:O-antigen ligase family protein [Planctomycetaceae bacterium]
MTKRRTTLIASNNKQSAADTDADLFSRLGLGSVSAWILGIVSALTAMTLLLNGDGLTVEGDNLLVAVVWQILAAALLLMRWYRRKPLDFSGTFDRPQSNRSESALNAANATLSCDFRFQWYDIAAVCFFGWIVVSFVAVWFSATGSPRMMLTMLSHWCGFAAMFVTWRLTLGNSAMIRGMLFLFVALTVAESAAAYYDYSYLAPKNRREFYEHREEIFRMNNAVTPGEQTLLEARVKSTEPLGTYSLTNSLAGVLVPWCVFFGGIVFSVCNIFNRHGKTFTLFHKDTEPQRNKCQKISYRRVITRVIPILYPLFTLLLFAAIFVLLVLTQSRSGLLAVIFGIACLAVGQCLLKIRNKRFLIGVIIGTSVVLLGVLIAPSKISDKISGELLGNATKSFGYRLQYWQSSLGMIADHPLFGCGVGNFKEFYTLYKLPTASETVSDPHNLFFETASNAGLPALAGLLALFAAVVIKAIAARKNEPEPSSEQQESYKFHTFLPIILGGGIGIIAAFVYSYTNYDPMKPDAAAFCLLGFGIGTLLFLPAILYTRQRLEKLAPVCFFALAVNLLAAGGIAFPHVNAAFWFLLALCLNRSFESKEYLSQQREETDGFSNISLTSLRLCEPDSNKTHKKKTESDAHRKSEPRFLCLAACFFAMASAFYPSAFLTNLRANKILRDLQADALQNAYIDRRITQLENAVQVDPYRTEAWIGLCRDLLVQHREFSDNAVPTRESSQNVAQDSDRAGRRAADNSDFREALKSLTNHSQRPRSLSRVESLALPEDAARAMVQAVRSAPSSAMRHEELGMIFFDDYQHSRNVNSLEIAVVLLERAAALYPNHSTVYVALAACYDALNEQSYKRETAQLAVGLDSATPHTDRKLPPEVREQMMRFSESE